MTIKLYSIIYINEAFKNYASTKETEELIYLPDEDDRAVVVDPRGDGLPEHVPRAVPRTRWTSPQRDGAHRRSLVARQGNRTSRLNRLIRSST